MTDITQDIKEGLTLALNEATIVGLRFDKNYLTDRNDDPPTGGW